LICDTFWCLGRGLSIQLDPSDEVVISETDGQPAEDECLNKNAQVPVRPSILYALRRILYWSKNDFTRSYCLIQLKSGNIMRKSAENDIAY